MKKRIKSRFLTIVKCHEIMNCVKLHDAIIALELKPDIK